MMKELAWTTQQKKVNDLIPLEINPRKISDEKRKRLVESIEKFNLVDIPVIDADNTVISGNQRLKALQLLDRGDEIIDVRMPNRKLSEKELKEYTLIANTHAGEWDMDIFDDFFSDVDLDDIGIDFDFTMEEISSEPSKERKKSEKKELKEYVQTHVLISFPPEKLLDIQQYLDKIIEFEFVEYEQSSN